MSHLRRKLEADGDAPGSISSVPSVGYVYRRIAQAAKPAPVEAPVAAELEAVAASTS
ncbi:MAG: winged helix-turn-helix domain-containing protein [Chloroflexi bacterium]|nr:MAG: winged helix-turn-helix domain-containing protein [Chloroflexota bacterium]